MAERDKRTVRKGRAFHIRCHICGSTVMTFEEGDILGEKGVVVSGLTKDSVLPMKDRDKVFDLLEKDDLMALNRHVMLHVPMETGLDGFCPDCDKAYCREHYHFHVNGYDSYSDNVTGVCPMGHRRKMR